MSSNMRILELLETAMAAYFGRKCVLPPPACELGRVEVRLAAPGFRPELMRHSGFWPEQGQRLAFSPQGKAALFLPGQVTNAFPQHSEGGLSSAPLLSDAALMPADSRVGITMHLSFRLFARGFVRAFPW